MTLKGREARVVREWKERTKVDGCFEKEIEGE